MQNQTPNCSSAFELTQPVAPAEVPTIVIYKSGDQVTRVVASQAVRVIVLDADSQGLEEDAPRTLMVDDLEVHVTDLDVSGLVGSSSRGARGLDVAHGEHGVDAAFVQQMVRFVEAMPAHLETRLNEAGMFAEPFPTLTSVPVKYWDFYEEKGIQNSHAIDIVDHRLTSGQFYLTVGALEGNVDDMISVCAEVGVNPIGGIGFLPAMSVHFDADVPAFVMYKVNDRILLRPNDGVSVVHERIGKEDFYVID